MPGHAYDAAVVRFFCSLEGSGDGNDTWREGHYRAEIVKTTTGYLLSKLELVRVQQRSATDPPR